MKKLKIIILLIVVIAPLFAAMPCGSADPVGIFAQLEEYDSVEPFVHGYACVGKNGLYGLINDGYELVVPVEYDCIRTFDILKQKADDEAKRKRLSSLTNKIKALDERLAYSNVSAFVASYNESAENNNRRENRNQRLEEIVRCRAQGLITDEQYKKDLELIGVPPEDVEGLLDSARLAYAPKGPKM